MPFICPLSVQERRSFLDAIFCAGTFFRWSLGSPLECGAVVVFGVPFLIRTRLVIGVRNAIRISRIRVWIFGMNAMETKIVT